MIHSVTVSFLKKRNELFFDRVEKRNKYEPNQISYLPEVNNEGKLKELLVSFKELRREAIAKVSLLHFDVSALLKY